MVQSVLQSSVGSRLMESAAQTTSMFDFLSFPLPFLLLSHLHRILVSSFVSRDPGLRYPQSIENTGLR